LAPQLKARGGTEIWFSFVPVVSYPHELKGMNKIKRMQMI
jgi:hypothetical protein